MTPVAGGPPPPRGASLARLSPGGGLSVRDAQGQEDVARLTWRVRRECLQGLVATPCRAGAERVCEARERRVSSDDGRRHPRG